VGKESRSRDRPGLETWVFHAKKKSRLEVIWIFRRAWKILYLATPLTGIASDNPSCIFCHFSDLSFLVFVTNWILLSSCYHVQRLQKRPSLDVLDIKSLTRIIYRPPNSFYQTLYSLPHISSDFQASPGDKMDSCFVAAEILATCGKTAATKGV